MPAGELWIYLRGCPCTEISLTIMITFQGAPRKRFAGDSPFSVTAAVSEQSGRSRGYRVLGRGEGPFTDIVIRRDGASDKGLQT